MQQFIRIRGAREHNLKNVDIDIPKNSLVVITGLSGSGKSTLAFDTLYAEGQRRYVESLSSYARQFLNLMPKPDVDKIEGLSPAISIEQKTISKNPRSTVGTITEIYDYLRLLYARIGIPYSPVTGLPIQSQTVSQIVDAIVQYPQGTKLYLLSPIARGKKGEFKHEFLILKKAGFERVFVDKTLYLIDEVPELSKNIKHDISIVVDRITIPETNTEVDELRQRLADSVSLALKQSQGLVIARDFTTGEERIFSENLACPVSGFCIEKIEPRLFSFNSPKGACRSCGGLGFTGSQVYTRFFGRPSQNDDDECIEDVLVPKEVCPVCNGSRLSKEALCIKIDQKNIAEISNMSIDNTIEWIIGLCDKLNQKEMTIAEKILKEIQNRLQFLINVGLEYLTLSRPSETLSGGESQRIRLASQIGSGLTGVMYVLDEPSIGLHQRDNDKLITTLKELRDYDNSVIVVEHDEDAMYAADWIVDMGPRAGIHGGEICATGTIDEIKDNPNSLTGLYLSGQKSIEVPKIRRVLNKRNILEIMGASANNLKNIDVKIPLNLFVCITGVSGSGKSTLIIDTLYMAITNKIIRKITSNSNLKGIQNIDAVDKVINISQSPIGRTPRSNPATYVGCFSEIRNLYAGLPEARARGYTSSRFSFNIKGGRCEACKGDGVIKVEMHFLPDVYVLCDQCHGARFNRETQEIKYKGKSISDVLDMTIEEAAALFKNHPLIYQKLNCLCRVGLGYLTLGHKATILSGGEAQRVKLAKELSKRSTGKTLYILDEPTTGLHMDDIKKLLEILHILVDAGNSVIVIEHNMDVIKTADWVIDIGPEGGNRGGTIVAEGTPETIAQCEQSHTGRYLKRYLKCHQRKE
ncbi:MAG: excinuclease ABC subunit UvrA [Holosporales bacterium]|jgi:excinuclease ABC subunit A|nr:excinuclease ABC subunit UvrA [Holosporales bacterium]